MRKRSRPRVSDFAFIVILAASAMLMGSNGSVAVVSIRVAPADQPPLVRNAPSVESSLTTSNGVAGERLLIGAYNGSPNAVASAAPSDSAEGRRWPEPLESHNFLTDSAIAIRGPRLSGEERARTTTSLWLNAPASAGGTSPPETPVARGTAATSWS